ncbi:type IX secretion system anionic LPS delivery protein PorZ [Wenyingzhuangia sp. IMCC45533]
MKYVCLSLVFIFQFTYAQKDFSERWTDFLSYNNIVDFVVVENELFAASDNAVFVYNLDSKSIDKISSVNGLILETINSISYDANTDHIILGHQNGLIQLISRDFKISLITGLIENKTLTSKEINGYESKESVLLAYGDFGILNINVDKLEVISNFSLSNTRTPKRINTILFGDDILYAASLSGVYAYNFRDDVDLEQAAFFNKWSKVISGDIRLMEIIRGKVLFVQNNSLRDISQPNNSLITFTDNVLDFSISDSNNLVFTYKDRIDIHDSESYALLNSIQASNTSSKNFEAKKTIIKANSAYISSSELGVLSTKVNFTDDPRLFEEIHPDGPSRNDIFSLTYQDNQIWVVYGGYDRVVYNSLPKGGRNFGVDYFRDNKWQSLSFDEVNSRHNYVKAIVNPFDSSTVLLASHSLGITEMTQTEEGTTFEFEKTWTNQNTNFILPGHQSVNQTWTANMIIDNNDMIWTANPRAKEQRFFSRYDGSLVNTISPWVSNIRFTDIVGTTFIRGFNNMFVDQNNNIFTATAENGILAFNADSISDESKRKRTNLTETNTGLASDVVFSVIVDENEKIWIGTASGLVVFDDYVNLYNNTKRSASKVVIEEGTEVRELLGNVIVRDIVIDQANTKWFATQDGGIFHTSSDGQTTFDIFNTTNSPLPSNRVVDLEIDNDTGVLFIVTDAGVVSFDTKSEPFGESITDVIAYPNPALRSAIGHEVVTIVAKDGKGIPDGTNIKIMDVSGKLVFETNISDDGSIIGGKVEWNKRNLRGNLVTSGIYIVLVSSPDGTENTTTKIAIVN